MEEAKFVEIPGFKLYVASAEGVIKNLKTDRILKYSTNHRYPQVSLAAEGKAKGIKMPVHRIIAITFVANPDPETKTLVNHKDGNTKNYRADNLEWVTRSENVRHAMETGLWCSNPRGREVERIDAESGEVLSGYPSIANAARELGICVDGIRDAIEKRRQYRGWLWREKLNPLIEGEEWRVISSCDDIELTHIQYAISNKGNVRNEAEGTLLKLQETVTGYFIVVLSLALKKTRKFHVHRLVATAFLETPEDSQQYDVDHKDSNRKNNYSTNLQWLDKKSHGQKTSAKRIAQIDATGTVVKVHTSVEAAAKSVDCVYQAISRVLSGVRASCKGYRWRYADELVVEGKEDLPRAEHKTILAKCRPIMQTDEDGVLVGQYNTIWEAAQAVGVHPVTLGNILRKAKKEYKGFLWEYGQKFIQDPNVERPLPHFRLEDPALDEFIESVAQTSPSFLNFEPFEDP